VSARRVTARSRVWRTGAVLMVVIVGMLAGGIAVAVDRGSDSDASSAPSHSASATPSATPTPSPTPSQSATPAPPNPDLFTPPDEFVFVPDETAGTGPIDAAKAAELDGTGALSQVGLQQLGFVRGVSRQWHAEPTVLVDLVYTFATSAQAKSYVKTLAAARKADPEYTSAPTPAGAPEGASTYLNSENGSNSATMVFASGSHAVVIGLVVANATPDTTTLATLAADQAAYSERS
jgi:hypothetical protein